VSPTTKNTMLPDTEPQVAAGKVLWHFTMSLDGTRPPHQRSIPASPRHVATYHVATQPWGPW
jgi:hypothetical protein